uniref:Uncharacterized protein n=1 Tax=Catharus ustulatus TaxID=91951 RepID=A0A8C3UPY6_CATUS
MTTIRQRRAGKGTEAAEDQPAEETNVKPDGKIPPDAPGGKLWNILSITVGGIVAISLGFLTSVYVATLHENDLWFSNIKVTIIFLVSSVVLWSIVEISFLCVFVL